MPVTVVHAEESTEEPAGNIASAVPPEAPAWLASRREKSPFEQLSVDPPPAKPISPPPLRGRIADIALQPKIVVDETPKTLQEWLARFREKCMTRNVLIGAGVSLGVHSFVLLILAFLYIARASNMDSVSLWGVAGNSDEAGSDVIMDTELPSDAGESAPLQMSDVAQSLEGLGSPKAFGDSIRVGFGGKGNGDGEEGTGASMHAPGLRIPGHAQTKGSFSAWADPRDPKPGQKYFVVIQIRLPAKITKFRGSDITGSIVGTDNYRQTIKYKSTELFPVENGAVEMRIEVPGAAQLVRDTIRVESKVLHEKQTFEIEF